MAINNDLPVFLKNIADAIREKKGTSELINPQDFSDEIASISSGGESLPLVQGIDLTSLPQSGLLSRSESKKIDSNRTLMILDANDGMTAESFVCEYNSETKILTTLFTSSGETHFIGELSNGDLIISGETASATYLYSKATSTSKQICYSGSSFAVQTGDKILLTTMMGVAVYDMTMDYCDDMAYMDDYGYGSGKAVGDKIFFGEGINSLMSGTGILMYDTTSNTFTKIYSSGTWFAEVVINDRVLFRGLDSSSKGIVVCDSSTGTATLKSLGDRYQHLVLVDNICFMAKFSGSGLLVYRYDTNALTSVYSSGSYWVRTIKADNDTILLSTVTERDGVLAYTISTNTAQKVYSTGGVNKFIKIGGKILLLAYHVHSYDISSKTFAEIYKGSYWHNGQAINDEYCLIASGADSNGEVLLYTLSTNSASVIYQYFGANSMPKFTLSGNNCYIEGLTNNINIDSNVSSTNKLYIKLLFDYDTKSISLNNSTYLILPSEA